MGQTSTDREAATPHTPFWRLVTQPPAAITQTDSARLGYQEQAKQDTSLKHSAPSSSHHTKSSELLEHVWDNSLGFFFSLLENFRIYHILKLVVEYKTTWKTCFYKQAVPSLLCCSNLWDNSCLYCLSPFLWRLNISENGLYYLMLMWNLDCQWDWT